MIIHSIRATNVLKYAELSIDLADKGLIGISGANESGKSSIGETVCFALFGRTFSVAEDEIDKVVRWGENHCAVTLEFSVEDQRYVLSRFLDRDGKHSAKLSLADKWLFLRAVLWLAVARIWLAFVPFPELARRLSSKSGTAVADPEFVGRVGVAISAAGANVPWRSDCFPQSIAAYKLLQRHGCASTIHLGVDKAGKDQLLAHAWLTCGKTIVTGGAERDRYVEIHRLGG